VTARRVLVVGAGQLGSALAADAARAGWAVSVAVRRPASVDLAAHGCEVVVGWPRARFDLAVVCVPDRAIVAATHAASDAGVRADVWLHTAGAMPGDLLRAAVPDDCAVGNMHPLAAVAGPADPSPLCGALFALAGEPEAVAAARELARALGGLPTEVPDAARPAYHAAAALVANDWVALQTLAEAAVADAGLDVSTLRAGLLHLARTAVDRVARLAADEPAIAGLTGAVRRGDAATLRRHFDALQATAGAADVHARCSAVLACVLHRTGRLSDPDAEAILAACRSDR